MTDQTALKTRRKPAFGSHGSMDAPRAPDDFYRSPTHAMGMLLDTIAPERIASPGGLVIDAGAGDGRLTEPLYAAGYNVRGVDLHDRDPHPYLPIIGGIDFLTLTAANLSKWGRLDSVVMNPPYSLAQEFVRHALALLSDGGEVHALLRHNWMCAARHADLLPCLRRVVMCARHLKMMPADKEHLDKGYGPAVDFSWFTFTKGLDSRAVELIPARWRSLR